MGSSQWNLVRGALEKWEMRWQDGCLGLVVADVHQRVK